MNPNQVNTSDAANRVEGELSSTSALSLDLSEEEVIHAIGNRLKDSTDWWNKEVGLDKARETNEKYWMNTYFDESELYDFQVPYKDNRIFVAIESLIPMALANPPQPLVTESADTDASRELARNLEDVLLAKYEDLYIKNKLGMVARHLLIGYRVAYMKYSWDNSIGELLEDGTRSGDIAINVIHPSQVVLDQGASDPDDIPLIGEYCKATLEELVTRYPAKEKDIFMAAGVQKGVKPNLSKREGYVETWFSYYKGGQKKEAVAFKYKNVLMGSMKNPNWNYDEFTTDPQGKKVSANFFDRPHKPYIPFNYLNLGKYIIDETSLTEQAAPLQKVLDKRGRQVVENADSANAGTIFNSDMISEDNVAKLLGDPMEKVMVKGDVTRAAMRLPQNQLAPFVLEDKNDARNEIDNIFATHDPMRGAESGNRTLGQDVLSQRSDVSRIRTLATALEDGGDRLYKGMVQMFKVFYDNPSTVQYTGTDGKTSFIPFSQNAIMTGMKVRVKSGSVLPDDPDAKLNKTLKAMPVLDPLTIAEGLGYHDPKEIAERIMMSKLAPDKYLTEKLGMDLNSGGTQDPQAIQEDQQMSQGQQVPPQQNPSKEHLATHQAFLQSPEYQQIPEEIRKGIIIPHIQQEAQNSKQALGQQTDQGGQPPPAPGQPVEPTNQPPQPPAGQTPPPGLLGAVKQLMSTNI